MRVLHVITALEVGGAERMLLKLLGARALSGIEQRVIAMLPGGALVEPMRRTGAQVDAVNFLGGLPPFTGAWNLVRTARRYDPDLVQGWLYHGNLGAALVRATLPRRVPLIWGIRQSLATLEGENMFARVGIALNKAASGYPDRLLFNSRTALAQHGARGFSMKRAGWLPNGFDTATFKPDAQMRAQGRAAWNVGDETVVFGFFARYHPVKDHAGFLRAAQRVCAARADTCFVMAGAGVDSGNAMLMDAVHKAGLGRHVRLLGARQDVADLLPALDVYVSSSRIEAFSNSVGEAMSCALPCVVTDVGDSGVIVAQTGKVVPPRDPASLADAMIGMVDIGAPGRAALGAQARQRIVTDFGLEAVAGGYAALYGELAGERS